MTVKDLVLEPLKHPLGMEVYAFSDNDETLPVSAVGVEVPLRIRNRGLTMEARRRLVIEGRNE